MQRKEHGVAMIRRILMLVMGLLTAGAAATAPGAIFVLSNGGQIEGELLNPNEAQRQTYVVRTAAGGRLVLPAKSVERVESKPEALEWYEAEQRKTPATAEAQWAMAEECKRRGLKEQR